MPNLLKRLELNGFKSFSGKTTLDFPAGVTAIVGPNGSGKSNIVDAIRWLLGEREAKNLRGAKAEDLIFAGNPSRPRQSLAQASLHFDNRNGFFPVDFAEVVISREVSRDGSSRYFLNKSEIRLKDLIDFFAKVRLGAKGMTIIGQGNSDLFIRATPKERREMIEEMLGLREYQIKKAQAENRLKNTRINLDKAKALIEEILPHLRSLRRQTGRWEKRGVLEQELKELERGFFGPQLKGLHFEIEKTKEDIRGHEGEIKNLQAEKSRAEEHQRKVEMGEPKEREELRKIKEETRALLEKRSQIQKEVGRLEAQIEIESSKGVSGPNTLLDLSTLVKKVREELSVALTKDFEGLSLVTKKIIAEIDSVLSGSRKSPTPTPNSIREKLESINSSLKSIENSLESLATKEKHLEKSQSEFHLSFKEAVLMVELVKSKIEEWESRNQRRLFDKEKLDLRLEELKRQITQANRHPHEFALEPSQVSKASVEDLREMEKKIFKLRGDLASIGEVDASVMKEAQDTESRYQFLSRELLDAESAETDLRVMIDELNEKIKIGFGEALIKINTEFNEFFKTMFGGGHAKLKYVKPKIVALKTGETEVDAEKNVAAVSLEETAESEGGIEIDLSIPKKRLNSLDVLSGGERSLVGIAALFAMISVSPPPFLVLDEIDAALDERNTRRFAQILAEFSKKTQFVVVTHNRATMEAADILYGVTLSADGTSKILSLKLEA
ncbi:MAG: Chromosome segregation protein SMC [Parcubacteria group bacterium Gr01-1014_20]|nr:MAG: Chromosome segregation protein SMC [Parcubacteria group bacterium Gr01-1014_20]